MIPSYTLVKWASSGNSRRPQHSCIVGLRQNNGEPAQMRRSHTRGLKSESLLFEAVFVDPQDTDPRVKGLTRNSEFGSCPGGTGNPPSRLSKGCFNYLFLDHSPAVLALSRLYPLMAIQEDASVLASSGVLPPRPGRSFPHAPVQIYPNVAVLHR
jgi:hypothetical protein